MKPLILQAEDDQARGQIAVVSWKYPNPAALRDPFSSCRDVAQPGRALAWGARGRQFKSARPDQSPLQSLTRSFTAFRISPAGSRCAHARKPAQLEVRFTATRYGVSAPSFWDGTR